MDLKKVEIVVRKGRCRTVIYPIIPDTTLVQFDFFLKKNEAPIYSKSVKRKNMYILARDICDFVRLFRQTPELIDFVVKLRILLHDNSTRISDYGTVNSFFRRLRALDIFFDFHEERGLPIQDQRVELLKRLRADVKVLIRFLKRRTE